MAATPEIPRLTHIPGLVTAQLAEYFTARRADIAPLGAVVGRAVSLLEDYVLSGGKRIRPCYMWAGFVAGGGLREFVDGSGEDPAAVVRAASSLELIQACALIHDDIIDSSDTRRGNPTVHRSVERWHRGDGWHGDAAHFGRSVALLVGDLAFAWADDLVRTAGLSEAALVRMQPAWQEMRTEVIGGQLLDIIHEASGDEDVATAQVVNRFKTAAYTIERPLHMGAAIAGADAATVAALRAYGTDIGVAFQLRDDLLGVFGDPGVTGKPAGDDLREGKRTVLIATALRLADAATAEFIRGRLGRVSKDADIAELTAAVAGTGAAEHVEKLIAELTASGVARIAGLGLPDGSEAALRDLAMRATARRT